MANKARDALQARLAAARADAEAAGTPAATRPVSLTPVAQHAREFRVGLETQVEELRTEIAELTKQGRVEAIDPTKIHRTRWCNRHHAGFADAKFRQLVDSIRTTNGNQQPIGVRPSRDRLGEYEIAYGHRRHAACLNLGIPVNAIVRELSDLELVALMHSENQERNDLSPYEEGLSYHRQIEDGLYASARELAAAIGKHETTVSKLLAYAGFPEIVLSVFEDPRRISLRMAQELRAALSRDEEAVKRVAQTIRESGEPTGFEARLSALLGARTDGKHRAIEVKGADGKLVVRAQRTARGYQFEFVGDLSKHQLKAAMDYLSGLKGKP